MLLGEEGGDPRGHARADFPPDYTAHAPPRGWIHDACRNVPRLIRLSSGQAFLPDPLSLAQNMVAPQVWYTELKIILARLASMYTVLFFV